MNMQYIIKIMGRRKMIMIIFLLMIKDLNLLTKQKMNGLIAYKVI